MRLFVAVNAPESIRTAVHEATAPLRNVAPTVRWVRADLLHLTMKFLGEVDEPRSVGVRRAISEVAHRHVTFPIHLAGIGSFPNFRRPRVVWIGVTEARPVEALASDVQQACATIGFPQDERPFSAHFTLGRVKRELPSEQALAIEEAANSVAAAFTFHVSHLDLMRSKLSARGPTYTTLEAFPLGAAS